MLRRLSIVMLSNLLVQSEKADSSNNIVVSPIKGQTEVNYVIDSFKPSVNALRERTINQISYAIRSTDATVSNKYASNIVIDLIESSRALKKQMKSIGIKLGSRATKFMKAADLEARIIAKKILQGIERKMDNIISAREIQAVIQLANVVPMRLKKFNTPQIKSIVNNWIFQKGSFVKSFIQ